MTLQTIWQLIRRWLMRFWVPLVVVLTLLTTVVMTTTFLLHRQQVTVKISNVPIHTERGVLAPGAGVLKKGEHLQILKRKSGWYEVRREDESKAWVAGWLVERTQPLSKLSPLSEATVVLDPGHGGSDSGALSNHDQYEKKYTLELAKKVEAELKSHGTRVIMTRDTDKLVALPDIPKIAEMRHSDMFISFHFDSAPESNSASGYTTYYYHTKNGSKDLASAVNTAISPEMPKNMPNKGVAFGDYLVLRDNKVPAILMENGYINSDRDFNHFKTARFQQKIADALPYGLERYLEEHKK